MFCYPITLKKLDGLFIVEFPDLDGCFTYGEDKEEALRGAQDCLETWMCGAIVLKQDIPPPKFQEKKGIAVGFSPLMFAKVVLYKTMRERRIGDVGLANRMRITPAEARRIRNPRHDTKLSDMEKALVAVAVHQHVPMMYAMTSPELAMDFVQFGLEVSKHRDELHLVWQKAFKKMKETIKGLASPSQWCGTLGSSRLLEYFDVTWKELQKILRQFEAKEKVFLDFLDEWDKKSAKWRHEKFTNSFRKYMIKKDRQWVGEGKGYVQKYCKSLGDGVKELRAKEDHASRIIGQSHQSTKAPQQWSGSDDFTTFGTGKFDVSPAEVTSSQGDGHFQYAHH